MSRPRRREDPRLATDSKSVLFVFSTKELLRDGNLPASGGEIYLWAQDAGDVDRFCGARRITVSGAEKGAARAADQPVGSAAGRL